MADNNKNTINGAPAAPEYSGEYSIERAIAMSKKKHIRMSPGNIIGLIFLILFCLVFLYPIIWLADCSLRPKIEMFNIPPRFMEFTRGWPHFGSYTLQNFINVFTAPHGINLGISFMNSIIVTVGTTVLSLLLCSLCAYAFAFLKFPYKDFLFYFILLSFMLPTVTMLSPYYKLMITLHLRNNLLGLILPGGVSAVGVFLMRQFYIKLPYSLVESAKIDGAGNLKIWWNIILPLSTPALAALSIFQFRGVWNDFIIPIIMLDNNNLYTIPIAVAALNANSIDRVPDLIMATGFLFSLIPILIFLIFQRYFIEGLSGGIKG
ncbi:MAG: carbohydrate ABC transporter permease [Brevinematales bacterium]|jgi:ABC-type glycerol-3-phosphate transport system permease component